MGISCSKHSFSYFEIRDRLNDLKGGSGRIGFSPMYILSKETVDNRDKFAQHIIDYEYLHSYITCISIPFKINGTEKYAIFKINERSSNTSKLHYKIVLCLATFFNDQKISEHMNNIKVVLVEGY